MDNRWKYIKNINQLFPIKKYNLKACVIEMVEPSKIISLSRPFEEIYNDKQMIALRDKIKSEGYNLNPKTDSEYVMLYKDEVGNYYVGSNGNHRTVLSFELGIEKIPCMVRKLVLKKKINFMTLVSDRRRQ